MPTYIRVLVGAPFESDICISWDVPPLPPYREHTQGDSPKRVSLLSRRLTLQTERMTTFCCGYFYRVQRRYQHVVDYTNWA